MNPADATADMIRACARTLTAARHVRMNQGGTLTAQQVALLSQMDPDQPSGVAELARRMGVSLATMSLSLDRLQKLGCIRRERGTGDRRRVNIHLTPAGRA